MLKRILFATILATLAVVVAACSTTTTTSKPKTTTKAPESGVQKGAGSQDATADVKIGTLSFDQFGVPHATATVTNHSSKTSDYFIDAQVLNGKGVVIDSGNALITNLAPGQTAKQELAITVSKDQNPAKLRLVEVQRTASS